jgi:hypothetical protein
VSILSRYSQLLSSTIIQPRTKMKAVFSVLALAGSALAGHGGGGWGYGTSTIVTYETTTVCPVTSTITKGGS